MKRCLSLFFVLFATCLAFAQDADYQRKYESGKELLKAGKYDLAKEVFRPLMQEAEGNRYAAYAHYFYALSSLKTNKPDEARLTLLQLLEKYPDWPDVDNAQYLLANVAFEKKDYAAAFNYLGKIRTKAVKEDADNLKRHYVSVTTANALKELQKKYPDDEVLAAVLVDKLMLSTDPEDFTLAGQLNDKFKLNRAEQITESAKSEKKDVYNISVLLPFNYNQLVSDKTARNNQLAVDMFNGIQMAKDKLAEEGVNINLLAYDIGNEADPMLKLINQPDFAASDLLIGPLYGSTIKAAIAFAGQQRIGQINPITNNGQILQNNPVAYLFQPSVESQARYAANYALQTFPLKTAVIIWGASARDSVLAHNYRRFFTEGGGKVLSFKKMDKASVGQMEAALAGYDDTKAGHIFIPSAQQNIAINFMSVMEKTFSKVPVITMANWLDYHMINFDQYERRNVHFIFPEFVDYRKPEVIAFKQAYIAKRNLIPSIYAYQGYELMMRFGKALGEFGTNFHTGMQSKPASPGILLPGFNYNGSNDNQYVPIIKFQNADLMLANPLE
jgi:TolA-binding protein